MIRKIPVELFQSGPLEILSFRDNKLMEIPDQIAFVKGTLKYLDISSNRVQLLKTQVLS